MWVRWSSLSFGWILYLAGLLAMAVVGEMTRSFEVFLAVYVAVGLALLSHRVAAGAHGAAPGKGRVLRIDVALFALLWPLLACVTLSVLSVARLGRKPVAADAAA
jgi:hypothetical protein